MVIKIKHISTRFLLQSIFTILIISTLIFIMFYSGYRKKDTLQAVSYSTGIESKLSVANVNHDKAFDLQKSDLHFSDRTCDELIATQNLLVDGISDSLLLLGDLKYLRKHFKHATLDDSVSLALQNYLLSYTKVILSLKEKGNSYGGKVEIANDLFQSISNELSMAPDNGIQAEKFNSLVSFYLLDYSAARLNSLLEFCDNVLLAFYSQSRYDIAVLERDVDELKEVLEGIAQIDQRLLNTSDNTGQLSDLTASYEYLQHSFARLKQEIEKQTNHYHNRWNLIFIFLALLLTAAYILMMYRFSRTVVGSVHQLHSITKSLASGSIMPNIPGSGPYEFDAYYTEIKALLNLLNGRKTFIEDMLNNRLNTQLQATTENDVIGKLLVNLQEMMRKAQNEQMKYDLENNARRYTNEGLAKFGEILRLNSHDTTILADEFIRELVKYMGALQGSVFLLDEQNKNQLHLMSAFAYDRKRFLQKTLKLGEGLVGTCALEKKVINLTELPDNYITIKSGLGDTPPNNLLLLPLMTNEEMVGVVEMATLKVFSAIEIELATSIASSLASTIISARNNSRTSELLRKSQQQAAEMAEQEEEMRQNLEELIATQEESTRREQELQSLLDAIGKSFFILEYDTSGTISHVNERLLAFLRMPADRVLYQKHRDVFTEESLISDEFIEEVVVTKKSIMRMETLHQGSKKYQYKYNLSPVLTSNGDVDRILNLFSIEEVNT